MNGLIAEFEHLKGSPNSRGELPHGSRGFRFGYAQRRCRPDGQDCVQCKVISDTGINEVHSCNGPNFHKRHADRFQFSILKLHDEEMFTIKLHALRYAASSCTDLAGSRF